MRALNRLLGGQGLHIVAAAEWPVDVQLALTRSRPRVLVVSGHFYKGCWLAEQQVRTARPVTGSEFGLVLGSELLPELIILNGCSSHIFATELVKQLYQNSPDQSSGVHVVYTITNLHDGFASEFCRELCTLVVRNSVNSFNNTPVQQAFNQACNVFNTSNDSKFCMGDPALHLHSKQATRQCSPPDAGCRGCNPPVHGIFRLLVVRGDGTIEQLD